MKYIYKIIILIFICSWNISFAQDKGKFRSIEEALANPEEVIELQLSGIDKKLPKKIKSLINLKTVRLINLASGYDLNDAFKKLGKYTSIKKLYLYGNPHSKLPGSLSKIKSLEFIELNQNLSKDLPSIIEQLSKLDNFHSLSLRSMALTEIPKSISQLKLKELNLDNNPQLNLNNTFDLLSNLDLESLNVSSAKFTVIPKSIEKLASLKRLELEMIQGDFNNEESFSNLSALKNLEELNIQGNFFGKLEPSIKKLDYLKLIEIDGNCIVEDNFEELKKLLPDTKIQNEIPC